MYLTTVMGITSLSVVLAVIVANISYRGQYDIPLPHWLRLTVLFLARLMCTTLYYITPPARHKAGTPVLSSSNNRRKFYRVGNGTHLSNDSGCALVEYEMATKSSNADNSRLAGGEMRGPHSLITRTIGPERSKEEDIDLILSLLKKLLVNEDEKEKSEDLNKQWEEAARIIDRFFFYIFLVLTIASTILTLVIMPLGKPENPTVIR